MARCCPTSGSSLWQTLSALPSRGFGHRSACKPAHAFFEAWCYRLWVRQSQGLELVQDSPAVLTRQYYMGCMRQCCKKVAGIAWPLPASCRVVICLYNEA